mmetsp:Transcript_26690/g.50766  ORF Transcript_26690/g.50766 Transcript_26690/m.50766 type:complete len:1056 (-) Transcript_26690:229-3396(-)|eukprot:CAMPEP_0114241892 /NCGR_PEP_ID=MMETSP0058-20121206/9875_1 /TAXON_ID=36894 /ORGANISM="Pyramimonas parkeae, CCMP726" /LENGTH=1055 /DNA_ID=CAMNT_0001354449 /DNA_START=232 /DNA_END=3399 /DNA_ORIENTATION=+
MNPEQLTQLEALCERLYNSAEPNERVHAEQTLRCFWTNPEYISQCQFILDNSNHPYAQLLASSSLVRQVTENPHSAQLRLDIRNYVLQYLFSRAESLQHFVSTALVQLLCRVTKLGWFDTDAHHEIVKDVSKFLQASSAHYFQGLKIFNQLTTEMNQPTPGRSLTLHRKTAVSFRDASLFHIFPVALQSLSQLQSDSSSDPRHLEQAVQLALKCLSFDFVGTSLDESTEDPGNIQVPSSWRPLIEDQSTMQLFLDVYAATKPPLSSTALECLTRLASVRRSLFTTEVERNKFLARLMEGTRNILRTQQGLAEHPNYHEYCKLLGRLKTNYQLSELVNVENYSEWIQLVAEFTIKSLQSWQWASGSVFYLLGLWSRLVSSMPYLKGDSPSLLEGYVPKITEAYIASRLDSVQAILAGNLPDDPLDNDEQLQDQLDSLPYLCRFQYESTSKYLLSLLDPTLSAYVEMARHQPGTDPGQLNVLEGQLTWLVYIVGALIRGRISSASAESQEVIDGEFASRIFQVVQVMDTGFHTTRYEEHSRQRLDIATLAFFQSFRKVYVGEQAMHASKVYTRLSERMGLNDHLMVLNITVSKIATNLKCYVNCDEVVEVTLNLFQDLASGYMSGKLLLKLDAINYILANHTREHFPFLDTPLNTRNRTIFYATLGRLLFMEDTPSKFAAFMAPFAAVCRALASQAGDIAQFRTQQIRNTLVGLFRDLRGIAQATNSRRTYGLLFDWLYPAHMPLLLRAVEAWADVPDVTTPVLKFMAEFVLNKTQRLTFDSSSPNGILLFRELSKIVVAYGSRVLTLGNVGDPYATKYKGIWVALTVVTRALSGNYVNFGVFELYGDRALADALDISLKVSLYIPLPDIMAFRKVAKAYFSLLEVLCNNHTAVICACDTPTFAHLVNSLDTGLKSLDVSLSSQCAASLDNLAAYTYNHQPVTEASPTAARALQMHLTEKPNLFSDILKTLFEIILFEDCSNQWSLSRPMLSLILLIESSFNDIQASLASTLPPEQQQRLATCFQKLMTDVTRSLEAKNRDKFTQNLTIFRYDFRAK